MNEWLLNLKRPFIWLTRFRHRCGYGVHSPFAFGLITDVIYEKRAYYAYEPLRRALNEECAAKGWVKGRNKVNKLLFRLVNRIQPRVMVEWGRPSYTARYLQAAKPSATYYFWSKGKEEPFARNQQLDFVYLNDAASPIAVRTAFDACVSQMASTGVMVVNGICYSSEMKRLWQELQLEEAVGITFDLYDVGFLFFDKEKIKQHYIVNF